MYQAKYAPSEYLFDSICRVSREYITSIQRNKAKPLILIGLWMDANRRTSNARAVEKGLNNGSHYSKLRYAQEKVLPWDAGMTKKNVQGTCGHCNPRSDSRAPGLGHLTTFRIAGLFKFCHINDWTWSVLDGLNGDLRHGLPCAGASPLPTFQMIGGL